MNPHPSDYVWRCAACDCAGHTTWCWYCRNENLVRYTIPSLGSSQLGASRSVRSCPLAPPWRIPVLT